MKSIKFIAAFGEVDRDVVILQVSGNLGGMHIYVDHYYHGSIGYVLCKWVVHWRQPTKKSVTKERYGPEDGEAVLDRLRDAGWID